MEIRFIKIDSKYASNNNRTITAQFDNDMVYVAVANVQGMINLRLNFFEIALTHFFPLRKLFK